jgi:hypothetical protein
VPGQPAFHDLGRGRRIIQAEHHLQLLPELQVVVTPALAECLHAAAVDRYFLRAVLATFAAVVGRAERDRVQVAEALVALLDVVDLYALARKVPLEGATHAIHLAQAVHPLKVRGRRLGHALVLHQAASRAQRST